MTDSTTIEQYNIKLHDSWTLYEHPVGVKSWALESYKIIGKFTNVQEIIAMLKKITQDEDRVTGAYLCLMRDNIAPIYESDENHDGGALTFRVNSGKSTDIWKSLVVHLVLNDILKSKYDPNLIHGLVITPKKENIIIQLWTKSELSVDHLNPVVSIPITGEILYRPHYERI